MMDLSIEHPLQTLLRAIQGMEPGMRAALNSGAKVISHVRLEGLSPLAKKNRNEGIAAIASMDGILLDLQMLGERVEEDIRRMTAEQWGSIYIKRLEEFVEICQRFAPFLGQRKR